MYEKEANTALQTMLANSPCSATERDFFIRGYLAAMQAVKRDIDQRKHHTELDELLNQCNRR
jgi:hypothetical protein